MTADNRKAAVVLCIVTGVAHILGGTLLVMLPGLAYLYAGLGLLWAWPGARRTGLVVAAGGCAITFPLLMLKLMSSGLMGAGDGEYSALTMVRAVFWLVMNVLILVVLGLGTTGRSRR